MTVVNFYNKVPSAAQIASDLRNDELVVFDQMTTASRELANNVEALVGFQFNVRNENTIPKWDGIDYFVWARTNFDYPEIEEKLRALAVEWVDAGYPNQSKRV